LVEPSSGVASTIYLTASYEYMQLRRVEVVSKLELIVVVAVAVGAVVAVEVVVVVV
jgi:hypothetical protein